MAAEMLVVPFFVKWGCCMGSSVMKEKTTGKLSYF